MVISALQMDGNPNHIITSNELISLLKNKK